MNCFWLKQIPGRLRWRSVAMLVVSIILFSCIGVRLFVSSWVFGDTLDNLALSRMGTSEILRYLDAADNQRGLPEEQVAAKYILGEIPQNIDPPARAVLRWRSMPPSEKRNLKVVWFREHYKNISIEEVNKFVNIDYLKVRAAAEYRESPLYGAPKELKAANDTVIVKIAKLAKKEKAKKKESASAPPVKIKPPRKQKKSDTDILFAGKSAPPIPPEEKAAAPPTSAKSKTKSDTGSSTDVNGALKKIPWGGIPNRMKNE